MKQSSEVYDDYEFAHKQNKRKQIILFATLILLISILGVALVWSVIQGIFFRTSSDELQTDTKTQEEIQAENNKEKAEREARRIEAYKEAKIPYYDPEGRFSIVFASSFVSGDIIVLIDKDTDYNSAKREADAIIGQAKKTVQIDNIGYKVDDR